MSGFPFCHAINSLNMWPGHGLWFDLHVDCVLIVPSARGLRLYPEKGGLHEFHDPILS